MGPWAASRRPEDRAKHADLWHLWRAGAQHFGGPCCARQTTGGQSFQFFFQVVLDPLNGRGVLFEEQIGSTGVAVVSKPNASGVDEKPGIPCDVANKRAMSMPKDNDRSVER